MSYIHCPDYPYNNSISRSSYLHLRDEETELQCHSITRPGPPKYEPSTYRDLNPSLVLRAHAVGEYHFFYPSQKINSFTEI